MTALRGQCVDLLHNALPLNTVRANFAAKLLISHQVRHFMGDCLTQKIVFIFTVKLRIKAQSIFLQMRATGFLSAQRKANLRTDKRALEINFRLLITVFNAGKE